MDIVRNMLCLMKPGLGTRAVGIVFIQGCSVTMEVAQDPAQRWEGRCGVGVAHFGGWREAFTSPPASFFQGPVGPAGGPGFPGAPGAKVRVLPSPYNPGCWPLPHDAPPLPRRAPLPLLLLFTEAKNKLGISWSHQLEGKGRWNDKKKLEVHLQLQSGEQPKMGRQPSPEREQKTRS